MRVTVNLDTLGLIQALDFVESVEENRINVKRGTEVPFELVFGRPFGVAEELEIDPSYTLFTANAATDELSTVAAHGLSVGDRVRVASDGTLPAGLAADTDYYVVTVGSATVFELSLTEAGSPVDITDTGSGSHWFQLYVALEYFKFGAKPAGKFDADYVVSNWDGSEFAYTKIGTGVDTIYLVNPPLDNPTLNDLLNSGDGNEDNDEPYVDLDCEVKWRRVGQRTATLTFTLRVLNDVNKGIEGDGPDPSPEWPDPTTIFRRVNVPAAANSAGSPNEIAIGADGRVYFYAGDGVTHSWLVSQFAVLE